MTALAAPTAANVPARVPASRFKDAASQAEFFASIRPEDLVYFLVNVGDGDTQLIVLPARESDGTRRALVVDVATTEKLLKLLDALELPLLRGQPDDGQVFPLVVATHPHDDHIGGMPEFLASRWGRTVREVGILQLKTDEAGGAEPSARCGSRATTTPRGRTSR